ncbi:MAG: class I SAM-dependent methyltransferase [Thermoanaerobaculia bacterium]
MAWDGATGSGQAVGPLAARFERVVATDASLSQLAAARSVRGVSYAAAPCELVPLASARVDLVTVGQALHWLDLDRFYAQVRRVLRPGGVVAAWSYGLFSTGVAAVDELVRTFHDETVGPYWPLERGHVTEGYERMPFPFDRVPLPAVAMEAEWSSDHVLGYLSTWSAVSRYRRQLGEDPVALVRSRLEAAWGEATTRRIRWPLAVLAGRSSPPATMDG